MAPGVLIPRQETELLLELALGLAPTPSAGTPLCWADLGTGSGCLAIALARALPRSVGLAVDASSDALRQAAANLMALLPPGSLLEARDCPPAQAAAAVTRVSGDDSAAGAAGVATRDQHSDGDLLALGVRLRQGFWWQAIEPWWGTLQLVVSNPPYIPTAVLAELEPVVREHEPALALDGGTDGLEAIRAIASGVEAALAPGGVLLLEHHHDQSEAVLGLLSAAGLEDCRAHADLEGVSRFASGRRPQPSEPVAGERAGGSVG